MGIIDNKLNKKAEELKEQQEWWEQNRHHYENVIEIIHDWGGDAVLWNCSIDINMTGGKRELTGLFRTLRRAGFKPNRRPAANDTSFTTFWGHSDPGVKEVWVNFTSSVCKRVRVGTEMKEVPVYEVQCSEPMEVDDE